MSVIALHTVNCDAGIDGEVERDDRCQWWVAQAHTAKEARQVARASGWAVGASGLPDYCPACAPEGWCPRCGASGDGYCLTASSRDHRERQLFDINRRRNRTQGDEPA